MIRLNRPAESSGERGIVVLRRQGIEIVRRLRWKGPVLLISGATGEGTDELKQAVMRYLEEHPRMPAKLATAD